MLANSEPLATRVFGRRRRAARARRTLELMAQQDYPYSDALILVDVGELDTQAWLAVLAEEVEPAELPEPVAVYLHEAREAGEV